MSVADERNPLPPTKPVAGGFLKQYRDGSRDTDGPFSRWPALVALLVLCGVLFFVGLGNRPLWDGDEGLHASTSREMVESGDWVTPRVNGVAFFDKPAFFNWLVAASYKVFGFTEFASRLPAALLGTLIVLTTWFFGRRMYGATAGFLSAVALATSMQFIVLSRTVVHDIALCLFITLVMGCFFMAFERPTERGRWMLGVYVFSALAVLSKGPIGVLLPGLLLVVFLVFRKRLDFILKSRLITGTLVFLLIAVPWYVLIALRNQEFAEHFFLGQNVGYFFGGGGEAGHPKPWYHHVPNLLGGFFPWSLFLPTALIVAFRRLRAGKRDADLYVLIWAVVVFVFFSMAESKLGTYIMPMFPACALLIGSLWPDLMFELKTSRIRMGVLIPLGFLAGLVLLVLLVFLVHPIAEWNQKYGVDLMRVNLLAIIISFFAALAFALGWVRRYLAAFAAVAVIPVVAILFFLYGIAPAINPYRTSRTLAFQLDLYLPEDERMVFFGEEFDSAYFYTGRQAIILEEPWELEALLASPDATYCIIDRRLLETFEQQPKPLHILGREGHKLLLSNRSEL